jgi:acyl-CoA reductase-like NAD-dependent aldehyde dehydrogenase
MSQATIRNLDPATGELIEEIPCATEAELQAKVARARNAWPAWRGMDSGQRLDLLRAVLKRLEDEAPELGALLSREMGKPLSQAIGEVQGYAKHLTGELDEVALAIAPQTMPGSEDEVLLSREPHGVVAVITPWNFPVGMPAQILIPALGAGNTVVFKPSEHVPLTGAFLARLFQEHLPDGVLELLQGDGPVGAALVEEDVDMIAFVGSRATGIAIMRSAAGSLKRLVLELGGKDPLLVFADADLEAAAICATQNSLRNTGQVCCSVERVLVERSVAERFEELVLQEAENWPFGDPQVKQTCMGPLVSESQRDNVVAHVADARERGARIALGGELPKGPGWYYPATVIVDAPSDAKVIRDETFGPVVCLTCFDTEDEAVERANDTVYGLGANVWTGDPERGRRVSAGLRAGQVGVNRYLGGAPGTPWVGARQSGIGFLGGIEGHRQFTTPKTVATAPS